MTRHETQIARELSELLGERAPQTPDELVTRVRAALRELAIARGAREDLLATLRETGMI